MDHEASQFDSQLPLSQTTYVNVRMHFHGHFLVQLFGKTGVLLNGKGHFFSGDEFHYSDWIKKYHVNLRDDIWMTKVASRILSYDIS